MKTTHDITASVQALVDDLEAEQAHTQMLQRKSRRFSNELASERLRVWRQAERIAELERELRDERLRVLELEAQLLAEQRAHTQTLVSQGLKSNNQTL